MREPDPAEVQRKRNVGFWSRTTAQSTEESAKFADEVIRPKLGIKVGDGGVAPTLVDPTIGQKKGFGMGFSLKKALKKVESGAKKVVKVNVAGAVGAASGFATGGVKGAVVGGIVSGANATRQVTSSSKGPSWSKLASNAAGVGLASGAVTGVVRSLPLPGKVPGIPGASGGFGKAFETAGANKFGVVGDIFGNVGKFAQNGIAAFRAQKGTGVVPGTDETPEEVVSKNQSIYSRVRKGFNKVRAGLPNDVERPEFKQATDKIRDDMVGNAKNRVAKFFGRTINGETVTSGGNAPVIVNTPSPMSPSEGMSPNFIFLAVAALAGFLLLKRRHV